MKLGIYIQLEGFLWKAKVWDYVYGLLVIS